jgi:hypothetical protein
MISLIFAAALSTGDLDQVLRRDALASYEVSESMLAETRTPLERRDAYCRMATAAIDGGFKLRKLKSSRFVFVFDDGVKARTGLSYYTLRDEDLSVVDKLILDTEHKAEVAKSICDRGL